MMSKIWKSRRPTRPMRSRKTLSVPKWLLNKSLQHLWPTMTMHSSRWASSLWRQSGKVIGSWWMSTSWNWKITSGKMPSQEVKKLPFGHFSLQNSEHFTLNEHPGSPLKTINNICNRAPFHFSCATFSRGMLSFMFSVVSFFSTRTTLMSQLPRLNLISFTGTLLEVMICDVLIFRKDENLKFPENSHLSGDLASAIAVTVLEENDRKLFYFFNLNLS